MIDVVCRDSLRDDLNDDANYANQTLINYICMINEERL